MILVKISAVPVTLLFRNFIQKYLERRNDHLHRHQVFNMFRPNVYSQPHSNNCCWTSANCDNNRVELYGSLGTVIYLYRCNSLRHRVVVMYSCVDSKVIMWLTGHRCFPTVHMTINTSCSVLTLRCSVSLCHGEAAILRRNEHGRGLSSVNVIKHQLLPLDEKLSWDFTAASWESLLPGRGFTSSGEGVWRDCGGTWPPVLSSTDSPVPLQSGQNLKHKLYYDDNNSYIIWNIISFSLPMKYTFFQFLIITWYKYN